MLIRLPVHLCNYWKFHSRVFRCVSYGHIHKMTENGKSYEKDDFTSQVKNKNIDQTSKEINGKTLPENCNNPSQSDVSSSVNNCTNDIKLPPKPEEPGPDDCCGNGCVTCVLDIYQEELERWQKECNRIKLGLPSVSTQTKSIHVNKVEYTDLELKSITEHNWNSSIYRFILPHDTTLSLNPGQHLILRISTGASTLTRPYTPISPPSAIGYFDVLIKNYADGKLTKHISNWKPGDLCEWRGPYGELKYKANSYSRVLLLAAGTGIAPMIQFIRHIVDNEKDETFVRLLYTCQMFEDILMKSEIDEWTRLWNFTVLYALSQDSAGRKVKQRYGDVIHYGRFGQEKISEELLDHNNDCLVLICGTKSFDKAMLNCVREAGVPEKNVFKF